MPWSIEIGHSLEIHSFSAGMNAISEKLYLSQMKNTVCLFDIQSFSEILSIYQVIYTVFF